MSGIYSNYMDIDVLPGCDFQFDFDVIPLDLTGCTAQMTIKAFTPGSPPTDLVSTVTCTTVNIGTTTTGHFDLDIAGSTTAAWVVGSYAYYVVVTFADGAKELLVGGALNVKGYAVP